MTDPLIEQEFSHYHIIAPIGRGGMGVVYKAKDIRLGRTVALKFLPPELTHDPRTKSRFVWEARAASSLDHPNICTIYDIDETDDGQTYISMAHYEGKTLQEKIKRGPLPIELAIDFTLQIVEGLHATHSKGIIHRDIKPVNIFITNQNRIKLLDFGLAKLNEASFADPGVALGTYAYMSPEQIQGKVVDQRTDLWSLGVVFYEMLTGKQLFHRPYMESIIYLVINEEPAPLQSLRPEIPRSVDEIVSILLQKDPRKRFQDTTTLIQELKRVSNPRAVINSEKKSIVVLPFVNLSLDSDQEYFSDGLTEEILTGLAKIKSLRVISQTSSMMLKNTKKSMRTIARELNVQFVLEGSVRKFENKLRITAQLIDARYDEHIWAENYDGLLEDIFEIQEKVSLSIVKQLRLNLSAADYKNLKRKPIRDIDAFDHYLRARDQINKFTPQALDRAVKYLKKAHSEIGENAAILSGLAYAYAQYAALGYRWEDYLNQAEIYAHRALEIDPDSAEALTVLGFVNLWMRGKPGKAINYFENAIQLRADDTNTLQWLAMAYGNVGRVESAKMIAKQAVKVDPLTTLWRGLTAAVEIYDGRYDDALAGLQEAREEMDNKAVQMTYAINLFYAGHHEDLQNLTEQYADIIEGTGIDILMHLLVYATHHQIMEMHQLLEKSGIGTIFQREGQLSWFIASAFACAGDPDAALHWMDNAVQRGFLNYRCLSEYDPYLSKLSGTEQFNQIITTAKERANSIQIYNN